MKTAGKYSIMWIFEFLIIGLITFSTINFLRNNIYNSHAAVKHTESVLTALDKIRDDMLNAETGQRGFIITGKEEYLEPYERAASKLDKDMASLRNLTEDSEWKKGKYKELKILVDRKGLELKRSIV